MGDAGAVEPPRASRLLALLQEEARREQAERQKDTVGNELLRRAALLRWLDAELYGGPLARNLPDGKAPSFEEFSGRPEMEEAAGQPGAFLVRDAERMRQIERWRSEIPALRQFSQDLVTYFEARKSPLDVFTHQIFADPDKAVGQFRDLYAAADAQFDLAECDTLLRILRNRGDLRGGALTSALNEREQYFRSRSLFADEWLRTARFLELPDATRDFEKFFRDAGKWLLRLFAAGGGGKTAYLRWLIARYCVPEQGPSATRIPVARIDLDFVHVPALAAAPWLLLIPLAEQLNRQLPHTYFQNFLLSRRSYAPLLQRPVSRDAAVSLPSFDETRRTEAVNDFISAVGSEPVLVVLDTFEELLVHHTDAVPDLVSDLARIHAQCSNFKVIISGRQDLFTWRDPVTDEGAAPVKDNPEPQSSVLTIEPWNRAQCWEYLTVTRELHPAMPFEKFPELGGGNPFKLSLFADLVGKGNAFTAADVAELRRVEVTYLVLRVIERIPESQCPLRWLLRYAVVPRQLTRRFVEGVLADQLQRAMTAADPAQVDAPEQNLPKGAEIVGTRRPWSRCTAPFDTARDWPALLRYAGSANWITMGKKEPRLQPEVVTPMRYLLQEQPVYWDIHREAVKYFEKAAEGDAWADMMCEAVYHQFQFAGSQAVTYWEECLEQPSAEDPEARRKLADLLLSGDFRDENHQPLPHAKTGKIIDGETIAKALLELAALDAREAAVSGGAKLLDQASGRLARVAAMERQQGFALKDDGRRALVEAAVTARSNAPKALETVDRALASKDVQAYRGPLLFLRGNIQQKQGDRDAAEKAFREAEKESAGIAALIPRWQIQSRLGRLAYERDDLAAAREEYAKALGPDELKALSDRDLRNLATTVIELDRSCANWSAGNKRLRDLEAAAGRRMPDLLVKLRGQLLLDGHRPELVAVEQAPFDIRLRGLALGMLGDFNNASRLLEQYWTSTSVTEPGAATQARFEQIQLILRDCRDYRRSRSLLSNLRDLGDYAIRGELLMLELDVRTGHREQAAGRWRNLRDAWSKAGPRQQARGLATALALELEPRSEFDRLLGILAQVQPAGARMTLLGPFELFQGQPPVTTGVSRRFQQTFPAPHSGEPDFVGQALLLAEALRFVGDRNSAAGMLKDALKSVTPASPGARPEQVPLRRRIITGLLRLDAILDDGDLKDYAARAADLGGRWPEFAAIAGVELAEWWTKRNELDLAGSVLSREPRSASQYAMRYQAARAVLEQAKGNYEAAQGLQAQAMNAASALGIPFDLKLPPRPSSDEGISRPGQPNAGAGPPPDHQLDLFTPQPGLMQVEFRPSGGSPMMGTYDMRRLTLFDRIEASDWNAVYQSLRDRNELSRQLKELIPIALENAVKERQGVDLRIAFSSGDKLAALPWEWASLGPFRFVYRGARGVDPTTARWQSFSRWMRGLGLAIPLPGGPDPKSVSLIEAAERQQNALVDGWSGPETRRRLLASRPLPPVALIKLSQEEERFEKTSYGSAAISVESYYYDRRIPFETYDPRYLRPEHLEKIAMQFALVHVCLPISELNGLLQIMVPNPEIPGLSPAFLRRSNPDAPRPVVILDPPLPPREQFWAQQLVWRNLFALHLFEESPVEAVIAAGLAPDPAAYLDSLLSAIGERRPAGEFAGRLKGTYAGAVVYAWDPDLPL